MTFMIYPNAVISVISTDGSSKQFDSEQLQSKIIKSCAAAGIKEFWIAEDIVNAVENALLFQAKNGISFSESQLNAFLVKILEDAGFFKVADFFKKNNVFIDNNIKISTESIEDLLNRKLGTNDRNLTKQLITACKRLKIKEAPSALIVELGKFYRGQIKQEPAKNKTKTKKTIIQSIRLPRRSVKDEAKTSGKLKQPWLLTTQEIFAFVSDDTKQLVKNGVLEISNISHLFPSLKINVNFEKLANFFNLNPILTEMTFFPYFKLPTSCIDEIIEKTLNQLKKVKNLQTLQPEIPVYLRFADVHSFSKKYFGINLPGGERFCKEIAATFVEHLKNPVRIKGISG